MNRSSRLPESLVSLVRVDEPEGSLKKSIGEALGLIQFNFDRKVESVVIKPNLCYFSDSSTGETTDPRFVGALIDVIREKTSSGINISIVESDASARTCQHAFRMLGYEKLAREKSVELVNLTENRSVKTEVSVNHRSYAFEVPSIIKSADMLINVPKIKYMPRIEISCALKNIYGCNPFPEKFTYHKWLDEAVVSLNKLMRSHLSVLDGIFVKGVKTARLGLVMASTDPVAFDSAASEIAGINPNSIRHIALASEEKIGSINFVKRGADLAYFKNMFPRKTLSYKMRSFLATAYNRFSP